MKAGITTLILLTATCCVAIGQTHLDICVSHRILTQLSGPVKKITIDTCINLSDRHSKKEKVFDKKGNLLTEAYWNYDGDLESTVTNTYDEAGCLISDHSENYKKGTTNKYEIVLNIPGQQIAYKNKDNSEVSITTHSPEKYPVAYKKMTEDKMLIRSSVTKRNPDNTIAQYIKYDKNGRKTYMSQYLRNENGTPKKWRTIDFEKERNCLYTYRYLQTDTHGNWTQRLAVCTEKTENGEEQTYEILTVRTIEYFEEK